MRLNKIIFFILFLASVAFANKETVNINFKNLDITDLIKITSKVINKNILMTVNVKGKVDFISNKPVYKEDILNILIYTLQSKGYTIVDGDGILRVIRINDAAKNNTPIVNGKNDNFGIVTEVFTVSNSNVDYISSKIRHLISSSAKLVTDKESNSIVVTDFKSNINTIKKVIDLISKDSQKHIEIIKLKNLQASSIQSEIVGLAKALYNEKIEKEKVSVLVNKDSNSIMIVGKKQNVEYLGNYLRDLDEEDSLVAKSVEVISLKNVESKNLLTMLTGISANQSKTKKAPATTDKLYIAADEESNSIILMGAKDEIKYYKEIIDKLDIDKQQVYVQARIIEVNEDKLNEVGIKYGLAGFKASTKTGLATFTSSLNGGTATPVTSLETLGGLNLDTMKSALSLGASLNLLNQNGAADIVSEPSILCINNKASSIYVGATKSIKTGSTTTSAGQVQDTYKREDIGLTLKIKPRISNSEKVSLEIETKLEEADEAETNDQPDTYKRELTTTAIVNNGESVILGGYIKTKESEVQSKVPFFGDIPVLGNLFKNKSRVNSKVNLVIIVTPYIIPKSKDLSYVRNQLAELKILEDQYTKDTIVRLEQKKLEAKIQDQERSEVEQELKEAHKRADDKSNSSKEKEDDQQKRINEMFGLEG